MDAADGPPHAGSASAEPPFDRQALEALFISLEGRLYNVVYRWLWNSDDAQDVVQETFMKLWAIRDTVRPSTASSLAFRVGVNLAASRRRRRKLWGLVGLGDDSFTAEALRTAHQGDRVLEGRQVQKAIDGLSEKLRAVVVLSELSGLSYAEIGALLNIPEGTVASRRSQAMAALKGVLGAQR